MPPKPKPKPKPKDEDDTPPVDSEAYKEFAFAIKSELDYMTTKQFLEGFYTNEARTEVCTPKSQKDLGDNATTPTPTLVYFGLANQVETTKRMTEIDKSKLDQLQVDQADANTYLQKKLDDNYLAIAAMEDKIAGQQKERREKEFELLSELNRVKERSAVEFSRMKIEIEEKEADYKLLRTFVEGQGLVQGKMESLSEQLVAARENHSELQNELLSRQDFERSQLRSDCNKKINRTQANMLAMAEEKLSRNTRRVMMEGEKMKNEVFYQEREMRKLHMNTEEAKGQVKALREELTSGRKIEENNAKKSHMYSKIIKKLKDKIGEKENEILVHKQSKKNSESLHNMTVKDRLDLQVKQIIEQIKSVRNGGEEVKEAEKDARERAELIRKCQSPLMFCLLQATRDIFVDGDGGDGDGDGDGDGGDNDSTNDSTNDSNKKPLHRGYTEDLLPHSSAASVSTRNVEQEIIDQTLDKELQKYLGLTGEEDDDDENNFYDSYAEDENDGSIKSLGVKKRTKHLRTLVAKIHNFQMNENEQAGVGDGVGDGVGEGVEEGEGEEGRGRLPPIGGGGGGIDSIPSRFFQPRKKNIHSHGHGSGNRGGKLIAKKTTATQTDPSVKAKPASSGTSMMLTAMPSSSSGSAGDGGRKKLHQGINSPAYNHKNIITINSDGIGLQRNFSRPPPMPIKGSHQGLERPGRQVTPEVKGWKGEGEGGGGGFGKRKGAGRKGNKKGVFKGNSVVWQEKMDELANQLLNAANLVK